MAYPDPPTTPQIPQRGDRATFSSRVDAFLTWVAAIIPWLQGFVADFLATLTTLAAGGANSFSYRFDSSTAVADPGPGFLRLAGLRLIIDPLDRNGVDISAVLNAITASTSSIKGSVRLQKVNDPTAWMLFDITGFTAATGYYNLTLALRAASSASPFAAGDSILIFTERNGDRGDNAGANNYAKFSDRKPTGTAGGAIGSSSNVTLDRTLNTTENNGISGVNLSGNVVSLPTGTYEVYVRAPMYNTAGNYSRVYLYSVTDSSILLSGPNSLGSQNVQNDAVLEGQFTITSPKNVKVQQFFSNNNTLIASLGAAATQSGFLEVYTEMFIKKVA